MSETITKNILAKEIHYETGLPITLAEEILDKMFEAFINSASKDGNIKIPKFGSFCVREKKERVGRNINTNTSVKVSARKVVSFYPSAELKRMVNEKKN
ncbi:MAG: HU family DNA-binding protein [Pseudomonadota bacterium]